MKAYRLIVQDNLMDVDERFETMEQLNTFVSATLGEVNYKVVEETWECISQTPFNFTSKSKGQQ